MVDVVPREANDLLVADPFLVSLQGGPFLADRRRRSQRDALTMKVNTVKQVKELISPLQAVTLKPNTKADLAFSAATEMTAVCQSYGQVFTPGLVDPLFLLSLCLSALRVSLSLSVFL